MLGFVRLRQQLSDIPVLAKGCGIAWPGGVSVIDSVLHWLSNGVRAPLCIFNGGHSAAFIGKDGRLYTIRLQIDEDGCDNVKVQEVKAEGQDWQLTETPDVAAVTVAHTERCLLVLDSKMELHVRQDDGSVQDEGLSDEVIGSVGSASLVEAAPPRPLPGRHVAQVACSEKHFLALTADGVVHSCGSNSSGQLGLGHTDFNLKMAPVALDKTSSCDRFAIFVACGSEHSAVLCEQGTAITFGSSHDFRLGRRSETWVNPWPVAIDLPGHARCVRVACGAKHSLFLTASGQLWGCGQGAQRQLGSIAQGCVLMTELTFSQRHGLPVDIFCHPSLNVSVVLTEENRFFICGEAGSLFHTSGFIEDFLPYDRDAVIIDSNILCMKSSFRRVCIPGFNDPEVCGVELVAAKACDEPETDPAYATRLLDRHLSVESLRRLAQQGLQAGSITAEDVIREHVGSRGSSCAAPCALTPRPEAKEETEPEQRSVFVGLDTIRVRSPYLWRLLQSPCRGNVTRHEDGRFTVEIHKYSFEALYAYGRYLHEDEVVCRPEAAMELFELAQEYVDVSGLAEQCAQLVRRTVSCDSLAPCLASCLFLRRAALAADITKLRLCVENACDVLQVVEAGDFSDPQAVYIRDIAMCFAARNATAVVKSERFSYLGDALKSRLFIKLATMGLLKT